MSMNGTLADTARAYATAYAAHYSERDLALALQLYGRLIASHANSREASYSRTQVQNIVNTVVPEQELLNAQTELALGRLGQAASPVPGAARVAPRLEMDE